MDTSRNVAMSSPHLGPAAGVISMARSRWSLQTTKSDRPLETDVALGAVCSIWLTPIGGEDVAAVAGAAELVAEFRQRCGRVCELAVRRVGHTAVAQPAVEA